MTALYINVRRRTRPRSIKSKWDYDFEFHKLTRMIACLKPIYVFQIEAQYRIDEVEVKRTREGQMCQTDC